MEEKEIGAVAASFEPARQDVRIYIGILFFRWKVIVLCFLYCLLGGVLFVRFVPEEYLITCRMMIYRDPRLEMAEDTSVLRSSSLHTELLGRDKLGRLAAERLKDRWGDKIGSLNRMTLPVVVTQVRGVAGLFQISIRSTMKEYAEDYLNVLIDEYKKEWNSIQSMASDAASAKLGEELARLDDRIRTAEDDLIEYVRLNDIARVEMRGTMESRYLEALMQKRNELTTELMMLNALYPVLETASASIVRHVGKMTRDTAEAAPAAPATEVEAQAGEGTAPGFSGKGPSTPSAPVKFVIEKEQPPSVFAQGAVSDKEREELRGWQELKVELERLEAREKEMAANLRPENPQLQVLRKQIEDLRRKLDHAAKVEFEQLRDQREALTVTLKALEKAEYEWHAKNVLASKRQAEYRKLDHAAARFESIYQTLYSRLHDMEVSEELKAQHFRVLDPVRTGDKPVWPDVPKILFVAVVLGLGSGIGIAVTMHVLDNKVQTIRDVETVLGLPFLGGIPRWMRSGLDRVVRPIVTEEHSTGAVEAYRALRTKILTALKRVDERVLIVTSADSKEGKTLTTLNVAIMVAGMGKKVLLVDMDLRRGRIHKSFGVEREPGMGDVLVGLVSLKAAIRQTRVENMWVLPCGSSQEKAAELLQSSDIPSLFREMLKEYEYVIVDTPPILRVADTGILITHGIGAVVVIAHANKTPKPLIRYAIDTLGHARIVGIVVNNLDMSRISSLYYSYLYPEYAYYSNAYAYGYDYYYYGDKREGGVHRAGEGWSWSGARRKVTKWLRRTFLPVE